MGKQVSAGLYPTTNKKLLNRIRREQPEYAKAGNIQQAYWAGKNPWITIQNPNKEETNKKFIRVKANTLYGSPKERAKSNFKMKEATN